MPYRDKERQAAYHREYQRAWRKAHPLTPEQRLKDNARSYAGTYRRRGKLKEQPCFVCGAPAQMHHPDYSSPLDVLWICKLHHRQLHEWLEDPMPCPIFYVEA
jgi:hypothetical protein